MPTFVQTSASNCCLPCVHLPVVEVTSFGAHQTNGKSHFAHSMLLYKFISFNKPICCCKCYPCRDPFSTHALDCDDGTFDPNCASSWTYAVLGQKALAKAVGGFSPLTLPMINTDAVPHSATLFVVFCTMRTESMSLLCRGRTCPQPR